MCFYWGGRVSRWAKHPLPRARAIRKGPDRGTGAAPADEGPQQREGEKEEDRGQQPPWRRISGITRRLFNRQNGIKPNTWILKKGLKQSAVINLLNKYLQTWDQKLRTSVELSETDGL